MRCCSAVSIFMPVRLSTLPDPRKMLRFQSTPGPMVTGTEASPPQISVTMRAIWPAAQTGLSESSPRSNR